MNWYVLVSYVAIGAVMATHWARTDLEWFRDWRRVAWNEVAVAFVLWPLVALAYLIVFISERLERGD